MIKKIILFGIAGESFSKQLESEVLKIGKKFQLLEIHDCIFRVNEKGKVIFLHQGKRVDFKNTYVVDRGIGRKRADIYSLLLDYLAYYKVPFDDQMKRSFHSTIKTHEMITLALNGLPYPPSVICSFRSFQANKSYILRHLKFPVILKGEGDRRRAVWKIMNERELEKRLHKTTGLFMIQSLISNAFNIRICIYDSKLLWAVKLKSRSEFYLKSSLKAQVMERNRDTIKITSAELKSAIRAAKLLDIDLAGVDIVRTRKGFYILEANTSPSLEKSSKFTGVNPAPIVMKEILKKISRQRKS